MQHGGGAGFVVDGVRKGDCVFGGCDGVFGVGGLAHVGYARVGGKVGGDVGGTRRGDGAGAFTAEDVGEGGDGVEAGSEVAVGLLLVYGLVD